MCDSIVVVKPGEPVWVGKNSDREPDEVQVVDRVPAAAHDEGSSLHTTHIVIPEARATQEVILSRPRWMWGCEMGVNARGVAIANEAVFVRLPLAPEGLTGMDLQRLALERAGSAADAVEVIIDLLGRFPQGGRMGFRNHGMRYASSFIVADAAEAWILETAGELWAAQKVVGVRTISNVLTINDDFDRIHPQAYAVARARGYCQRLADFGFARCFASRFYRAMTGGEARRGCTRELLSIFAASGAVSAGAMATVLRDHGGVGPQGGLRMVMPCAHASWLPTRASGQTTASMIACLDQAAGPRVWMTGTSSPCLSVFKPVGFGHDALRGLPQPGDVPDGESLWWRHERLHRAVLADYDRRRAAFEAERARLEAEAWSIEAGDAAAVTGIWEAHRQALPGWLEAAAAARRPRHRPFHGFWARKARQAG